MRALLAILLLAVPFAGCLGAEAPSKADLEELPEAALGPRLGLGPLPNWTLPVLVDDFRAGGEPVIAIAKSGAIIVSAHPGYTHVHPDAMSPGSGDEALLPTQGQSYLWRSTDGGASWEHVTLLPVKDAPNSGPRGVGQGVSDPDLTVDANGRIWLTDLEALAEGSLSWSDDDGATWLMGNNVASEGPIDRQWLASFGGTLFFTGNYFGSRPVRATEDGLVFEERGQVPCGGDLVANPVTGALFAGCSDGFAHSEDGGRTWERAEAPGQSGTAMPVTQEPALDSNGTVYTVGEGAANTILLSWTTDLGATWKNLTVSDSFPELDGGVVQWPWVSAGSEGRAAVTFMGHAQDSEEWRYYNLIVINATSANPELYTSVLTPEPFHVGPICNSGTACQATTLVNDASDRRLGDFFESTVDRDGFLHVAFSDTHTKDGDAVSHVSYVRLTGGPRLVLGEVPEGFPTQG